MVRIPTHRTPTHPGEMLLEEFLVPGDITQRELASAIHVPYQRVNEIVRGRRGMTPGTSLRLAKFFGTSADFWLNLQLRWDLFHAQREERAALTSIQPRKNRAAERGQADESVALLKILDLGNSRIKDGKFSPAAEVIKRMRVRRAGV